MELRGTARYATRRSQHEEVRFCKNELTCSGVNRSECIVRDFYNFEAERTPADDVTIITRLIMECQTLDPVAIAKYLVQNGVSAKS